MKRDIDKKYQSIVHMVRIRWDPCGPDFPFRVCGGITGESMLFPGQGKGTATINDKIESKVMTKAGMMQGMMDTAMEGLIKGHKLGTGS